MFQEFLPSSQKNHSRRDQRCPTGMDRSTRRCPEKYSASFFLSTDNAEILFPAKTFVFPFPVHPQVFPAGKSPGNGYSPLSCTELLKMNRAFFPDRQCPCLSCGPDSFFERPFSFSAFSDPYCRTPAILMEEYPTVDSRQSYGPVAVGNGRLPDWPFRISLSSPLMD